MIVVLIGYMASGKSTLGRILANKLNYDFIDLDDYIEEKEQLLVSDIFKSKGELYFRKMETLYLKELLDNKTKLVLSLGGGTPCYSNNMDFIRKYYECKEYLFKSLNTYFSSEAKKREE